MVLVVLVVLVAEVVVGALAELVAPSLLAVEVVVASPSVSAGGLGAQANRASETQTDRRGMRR
ncbi:hypothetical protein [Nannocystis pusilla]|uniref:hypothetical protein n=1 Tax=Nannocystis pusilla TaxID=889268 RepID=UPI003B777B60